MASRVRWKSYARFRAGENLKIISKDYLSLLAYGCAGCDGDGAYAEITQVLTDASADKFSALIVEDADRTAAAGDKLAISVYACPVDGAPVKLSNSDITVATGDNYTYADGVVTIGDSATGTLNIAITSAKFPALSASLKVTIV